MLASVYRCRIAGNGAVGYFSSLNSAVAFLKAANYSEYEKVWDELMGDKDNPTLEDLGLFLANFKSAWNRNNPDCIIVE